MIETLIHLLIVVVILGAVAYFIAWVPITPPIIKTILWIIFVIIALYAILPFLGIPMRGLG